MKIQGINCRIDELTPEHQLEIVRLINSLASHGNNKLELFKFKKKCPTCHRAYKGKNHALVGHNHGDTAKEAANH